VFVKEESARLGLPAFKILGASYAVARALSARLGAEHEVLPLNELRGRLAGRTRLYAATDGNHGRAVAHMAYLLGLEASIYIPADVSPAAKDGIAGEGAHVEQLQMVYDDVVARAAADCAASGGLLIQDTAWPGYEQVPQWIVDGYSTLFEEADAQLARTGAVATVVAVPIGVGSLAQAAVRHYRSAGSATSVLGVEPEHAPA